MHAKVFGPFLIGIALSAAVYAAPNGHVVVEPRVTHPDNVTQPALLAFMKSAASPTIVLRVPAPQTSVSQSQGSQGSADLSQGYLAIEKELVKAGFVVRDRGLLEEILRSNQNLDYRGIQQKIDAQLILEIVSIAPRWYATDTYVDAKNHKTGQLRRGEFPISGWHFESRVVMVNSGEIGGIYAEDVVPEGLHFIVAGNSVFNASPQGKLDRNHTGYAIGPVEEAAPLFVRSLISSLKPGNARAAVGVGLIPMTPDAIRQLGFKIPKKVKGAIVANAARESRAEESGLHAGDVIERVGGRDVASPEDVMTALGSAGNQSIAVTVNRGGKEVVLAVPAP